MAKKEKPQKALEETLFEACNKLRSNMSGINYMYFVMGLVFLKFASLKFEERRNELQNSDDGCHRQRHFRQHLSSGRPGNLSSW